MGDAPFVRAFITSKDILSELVDAFKFFPIFLLLGYLKYAVGRWHQFISYGYSIQVCYILYYYNIKEEVRPALPKGVIKKEGGL